MFDVRGSHNTAHVFATTVDLATVSQLIKLCSQPWTEGDRIATMPDCHAEAGCAVGSTMTVGTRSAPTLWGPTSAAACSPSSSRASWATSHSKTSMTSSTPRSPQRPA